MEKINLEAWKNALNDVVDEAATNRKLVRLYHRVLAQLILTHGKVNEIGEVVLEADVSKADDAFAVQPWQLLIGSGTVTIAYDNPLKGQP